VRSFDPDEETRPVDLADPDGPGGIQLDDDLIEIDQEQALRLLDEITAELAGGGEVREGQRQMVRAVAAAFSRRQHTIVEAGTGIGKSLAYLIPAALSRQRVVVATATKNLQDQLATKDAPLVAAHVPGMRVSVLKGKSNYLCRNRAQSAGGGQLSFDDGSLVPRGVASQMRRILQWSQSTTSGDRDELDFEVDGRAWRALSVTPQECLGRTQCPQGQACFAELAKDRAAESSLLIVNTHLYAAHLASGSMLLPAHELVVFDEAHEALDIFASLLGTSLSASRLRGLAGAARGVLGADVAARCDALATQADRLADSLTRQYERGQLTGLGEDAQRDLGAATAEVTALIEGLRAAEASGADGAARRTRALGPAVHLGNDLVRVSNVREGELLYLVRRDRDVELELSLVDVGPRLRDDLWGSVTAVLSSATIPDNLARNLGLEGDCVVERFDSPFDYRGHSLLYVPEHFPARTSEGAEAAIIDELVELIRAARGRTLALFTNRSVMERVAEAVAPRLETPVLVQGTLSRPRLIEAFRGDPAASLFAVTSFWQGVDVPGHSLSLVAIDRLPFAVPSDPLAEARRGRAANPFYEVDLPRAAMLLAQGVGRLIRTKDDRGVVAVLDTRLAQSSYRASLFKKLPAMRRTRDKQLVHRFLADLAARHAEDGAPVVE
jgi:ATP-dependent DNA helicase DinG